MLAYRLERLSDQPVRVTLFEASERLGGKVLTRRFESSPVIYEAGAAELYDNSAVSEDPLRELVRELRLPVTSMAGTSVELGGHIIANLDDLELAFGTATRSAVEAFDRRARGLMSPRQFYDSDQAESFRDEAQPGAFRQLLDDVSNEAARRYLEVMMHSDLATEPERTNLRYGLQNYLMNDPAYMSLYRIDGGNERLTEALAARISTETRTRCRLHTVEARGDGRLRLHLECAGETVTEEFDSVALALPLAALEGVTFRPASLAEAVTQRRQQFDHPAHYLRITALFERPFWRGALQDSFCMLEAFGGACLYDETPHTHEVPHGVLGWLIGGDAAETRAELPDAELVAQALASLPRAFGDPQGALREAVVHRWMGSVNAMPGGQRPWGFDQRHRAAPLAFPGLFFVGDYLYDSTLNGVLESAEYVASQWAAELSAPLSPRPTTTPC